MSKKYRLLKPTPDSNVGDVYIWNESQKAYYKDGNVLGSYYPAEHVENNSQWFEEVTDTERIEVSEFVIGVDAIRGNFEWKDDAQAQVIFKASGEGEWIAMYRKNELWSQQKFEADMKKTAEYFSTVPLLCEECGEIGKHKPTCPANTPTEERIEPKYIVNSEKLYTQSDLDKARENAFNAGRMAVHTGVNTSKDYLNSINK